MKLKFRLPVALIVVALAMPPTAAASTKPLGFTNDLSPPKAEDIIKVMTRPQIDLPYFILTSTSGSLPEQNIVATATDFITAHPVGNDQEVSLTGDSGVLGSPTNTANASTRPSNDPANYAPMKFENDPKPLTKSRPRRRR